MSNLLFTIIIPSFNAATTICRSLDSVYALPFQMSEFEVIVVNDGSTDETDRIVEEYGVTHENLIQIRHLVNRNLGAARNSGIAAAKGQYVVFLDSDDELGPGIVDALELISEKHLDMVAMQSERVDEAGRVVGQLSLPYSRDEIFSGIQLQDEHPFWNLGGCTNYLYSKSLLGKVSYPFVEGAFYEDVDFVCNHLLFAGKMSYIDKSGYRQFMNPTSITHTFSYKHVFGYAFLGVRLLSLYEKLDDKSRPFSLSVLEGGAFNIMKAFKYLLKLHSLSEVRAFYNLFDSRCNRKELWNYTEPAYCWTWWTRLGVKSRFGMVFLTTILRLLGIPNLVSRQRN